MSECVPHRSLHSKMWNEGLRSFVWKSVKVRKGTATGLLHRLFPHLRMCLLLPLTPYPRPTQTCLDLVSAQALVSQGSLCDYWSTATSDPRNAATPRNTLPTSIYALMLRCMLTARMSPLHIQMQAGWMEGTKIAVVSRDIHSPGEPQGFTLDSSHWRSLWTWNGRD